MKSLKTIVIRPLITEKSSNQMTGNKYSFIVNKDANKVEITTEIEQLFGVKVVDVNTMNYFGKTRRVGKGIGKKADWKKAVVTISEGQKISNFEQIL